MAVKALVLDSSSLVSIHLKEPGHEQILRAIEEAEVIIVGAPTLLETGMLLSSRLGHDARPILHAFVRRARADVIAFDEDHLYAATTAFLRFGRGRHPAALNFGDCMSYAVAAVAGLPLLFTGNDFSKTDIPDALG